MESELTNLLPPSKTKALRRDYFLRLATVVVLLLVLLVIIHGVLLVPSYLYATEEAKAESMTLDKLTQSSASMQVQQTQQQLSTLRTEATYLSKLASTSEASATIRSILAVPRPGIALTGFVYAPPSGGAAGTMQISGVAATRELLSNYNQSLSQLPFVTNANLPISDYAKESDIPFEITLTGTLAP